MYTTSAVLVLRQTAPAAAARAEVGAFRAEGRALWLNLERCQRGVSKKDPGFLGVTPWLGAYLAFIPSKPAMLVAMQCAAVLPPSHG